MGRSRRSTPRPGEPAAWGRATAKGAGSDCDVRRCVGEYRRRRMARATARPWVGVRRIQTKLHCWAAADRGRRFDDLYNLVCDPAVSWWWRGNASRATWGRGPPGIDRATVAWIVPDRGERVPARGPGSVAVAHVHPGPGAPGDDPQGEWETAALGIPTVIDRVVQAVLKLVLEPIFEADFQPVLLRVPGPAGARRTPSPRSITSPPRATAGCWRPTSRRVSTGSITPR